jgi:effector-binding domain-containing protein
MKVLKIILIVIVVILGGMAIWMATLDGKYDVNRSVFIETTPEAAYAEVSDFKTWPNWGPWFAKDSTMTVEFGEITQGAGATYKWTSENQGNGNMEILEAVPGKTMKTQINFDGMGSSNGYWIFEAKDGGTQVTWGFNGEMPFFFRFWAGGMDAGVGPDFEKGLNSLKEILEARKPAVEITEVMLEPLKIYYTHHNIAWDEMGSDFFGENFGKIGAVLAEDMANMTWAPMALYHVWDEVNQTTEMDVAIPCASEKAASGDVLVGMSYGGKALKTIHLGDYSETGNAHLAMEEYMTNNQFEMNGPAMEVYVTDPMEVPDTAQWVTEIYYPIK